MKSMPGFGVRMMVWSGPVRVVAVLSLMALAVPPAMMAIGQEAPQPVGGGALERSCVEELRLGLAALDAGDAERALVHYRAAVAVAAAEPLRFQALLGLGSTYAALRRFDTAVEVLERARDLAPEDAGAWYTLGTAYAALGRTQQALDALATAARLEPSLAQAQIDRCVLLAGAGRYADAESACGSAVEAAPGNAMAWIGLGVARYQLTRYEAAAAAFREALSLEPDNARAIYGLGLALLFSGDKDGAVAQYVSLKPHDSELARDLYARIFP